MVILVDAMGGDNAPVEVIKGAIKALDVVGSDILLVGDKNIINSKVKELYNKNNISEISSRIKVHHTTEVISNDDTPIKAIKSKKDSSMVVALDLLKSGKGDILISAGNTGALMAGGLFSVGRIKGIDRPALGGILPAYKKSLLLIDSGANTNCKPINLVQFAQMGSIYLKTCLNVEKPVVGLLNIGTEETKGNDLTKESYIELKKLGDQGEINFAGNIEGREAFSGDIDIVVADGFTGNVFLKTVEGFGGFVKKVLMENMKKNIFTKIGALFSLPAMNKFKKAMDYKEYGGALLLGIKKPIIKAHGSSDEKLFLYTIKQAERFVKSGANDMIIKHFEKQDVLRKELNN